MGDAIILPPLPEPVYTYDEDGNKVFYEKASLVRARDLEVVRLVLEAAAKVCKQLAPSEPNCVWEAAYKHVGDDCAAAIRALEFRHE